MKCKKDITRILQTIETQLDSISQKLQRQKHPEARRLFKVLVLVRTLQNTYPATSHSLLRYSDCEVGSDGKIIQPLSKKNWRKYRKLHPPKNQLLIHKYTK